MIQKMFEFWNWELDKGERPISSDSVLPPRYAIAYYDYRGCLYRVVKRVKERADGGDDDPSAYQVYVYDYFSTPNGRVLQKRSLNEDGSVFLIVDCEYNDKGDEVKETAWWPSESRCQSRKRQLR